MHRNDIKIPHSIALYAMFKVSRRKPTLIIVPTQAESFVFKASILWNTYQTLPEGIYHWDKLSQK